MRDLFHNAPLYLLYARLAVYYDVIEVVGEHTDDFLQEVYKRQGLCICFDMRFPELARIMSIDGAWAVFCPASFNMTTGPAHWEIMFRSRAVESQVYALGCAPARDEHGSYVSYSNSIIVHPWGNVLARAGAEECILRAEISREEVESVRSQLPLMSARRTDMYTLARN